MSVTQLETVEAYKKIYNNNRINRKRKKYLIIQLILAQKDNNTNTLKSHQINLTRSTKT